MSGITLTWKRDVAKSPIRLFGRSIVKSYSLKIRSATSKRAVKIFRELLRRLKLLLDSVLILVSPKKNQMCAFVSDFLRLSFTHVIAIGVSFDLLGRFCSVKSQMCYEFLNWSPERLSLIK